MSDETQQDSCKKDPAPQPNGLQCDCVPLKDDAAPPTIPALEPCETCCDCPEPPPPAGKDCFAILIGKEDQRLAGAVGAEDAKKDLEAFRDMAKAARETYTDKRYGELLDRWKEQDAKLATLIHKITCQLTCTMPCWWCVFECLVCPKFYAVRDLDRHLNGTRKRYTTADSLYDLDYWWTRELAVRAADLARIEAVRNAWKDPSATIGQKLDENDEKITLASNVTSSELLKTLYDLLFVIVPLHLAIAPSKASGTTTAIERKYVNLCKCDDRDRPDACCGPNVGTQSVLDRLVEPQPYLLSPGKYVDLICCLAEKYYQPAKEAWAKADREQKKARKDLEDARAEIDADAWKTDFHTKAKAALDVRVDCEDYKPKQKDGGGTRDRRDDDSGCGRCDDDKSEST